MEEQNKYLKEALAMKDEITEMRRHIHHNPELGLDTRETAGYVIEKLKEFGYDPAPIGTNSVTATVGKGGGKVFLLRADMDALPIQEDSGLPFASKNEGKAHCCGHDLHTAMLLAAAKILKLHEDEIEGTVKLLFQAGEENMQGARDVLKAGILENPHVDAGMAIHVNSLVRPGRLIVFTGPTCASSDLFTIKIKGCGCHGARPEEGVDPLNVATHIHLALQELQARELKAGDTGVLTIGCIKGGTTFNVIPDDAIMMGTIRTYDNAIRERFIERMKTMVADIAHAFRAEAEVIMSENYTIPLVSDAEIAKQTFDDLKQGFPDVMPLNKSFPGSEDFAFITDKIPAIFIVVGANAVPGTKFGQHHPKVIFNEECLPVGAAAHVETAVNWLKNNR